MNRFGISVPLVVIAMLATRPAVAQFAPYPARVNQQRGATVGGLAGAALGAIIGDNSGEAGAGAAIGGVVGAVAGGVLGNAADKERAYAAGGGITAPRPVYRSGPVYPSRVPVRSVPVQTVPAAVVTPQTAVGVSDVIQMSRSGLGSQVIINQIESRGVTHAVAVSDIIEMHRQGVAEHVITAMQRVGDGVSVAAAPVVVEPVVVTRPVAPRINVHHYHPHPRGFYRGF